MRTLTFRVTGRVQGVWFRAWTQQTAQGLGLSGWVRNEPDGSVSGQAQTGGSADGDAALTRLRELLAEGPPSARVAEVRARFEDAPERFDGFVIRR